MLRWLVPLSAVAVLLAIACPAPAALIVDWGGNYVSTTVAFSGASGTNRGGFSSGDPLLISPTSSYTGGDFYGHVAWTAAGQDGNYASVVNATADRIEIKRYDTDLRSLILWRQGDFLNGLDSGNIGFDAGSTASMNINTLIQFDAGHLVIRLEGGSSDGYYISQETPFDGAGLKSANLTALTWLAYDPATSLTTFGTPVNLLSGGKISHVTEVGFYTRSNNSGSPNAFRLDSFEVTAALIPEPATLALLALGGTMIFWRRR
ncbi:MAG: PEP-CTERM sorting domain-containing protein [Phycisphaeraceae bacterium]